MEETTTGIFICNNCGELLLNPEEYPEEYCPSCGAILVLNQTYRQLILKEGEEN